MRPTSSPIIREATEGDAEAIRSIYAPIVRGTATSFELDVPTLEEMALRVRQTGCVYPWLVFEEGDVLGYAYATRFRARSAYNWCCETSVYVGEGARGRGVGLGLYTSLLSCLDVLGYHAVYAGVTLPNEASVRLHESLGFDRVGVFARAGFKHGKWRDVGWWQRIARENPGTDRPPLAVRDVAGQACWSMAVLSGVSQVHE